MIQILQRTSVSETSKGYLKVLCRHFLEVRNSIFLKFFLFDINNNASILRKITFKKILPLNG